MRIRPAVLGQPGARQLFYQTFEEAGVYSVVDSDAPDDFPETQNFLYGDGNFRARSQSDGLEWRPYGLFYQPIKPGDIENLCMKLHVQLIGASGAPKYASGSVTITMMTTPALGWDPLSFTYNTKPPIDPTDPHITQHFEPTGTASVYTEEGYEFIKNIQFDFTKINKVVVGFAIQATIDPGLTNAVILCGTQELAMWTSHGPLQYPIIARESLLDPVFHNSIRRLYLPPGLVAKAFPFPYLPHNGFNGSASQGVVVTGVGIQGATKTVSHPGVNYYDSDLSLNVYSLTPVGGFYFTNLAWNAANDTLDLQRADGMTAYVEGKTACGGTIYYNL